MIQCTMSSPARSFQSSFDHAAPSPLCTLLYDDCVPASAIEAAFASATLFMSPCLPFCAGIMVSLVLLLSGNRPSYQAHSHSTWRISTPSRPFVPLPVSCHPSSFVEQLARRRRGICCSWIKLCQSRFL